MNRIGFSLSLGLFGSLLAYGCTTTDSQPNQVLASGGSSAGRGAVPEGGSSGSRVQDSAGASGRDDSSAGAAGASEAGAGGVSDAGGDTSTSAAGSGDSGAGGSSGSADCGDLGEACCADSCHDGLACLGGAAVCSCVSSLHGAYVIRTDGALLAETSTSQITVLDSVTSAPLAPVTSVQDGYSHGCAALGDSHTAWCWRVAASGNSLGQLGNGAVEASGALYQATEVLKAAGQPLSNVASVASGASDTACAVLSDGTVFCWGDISQVLNAGTTLDSAYATRVTLDGTTPLSGVKQVVLGAAHACALVEGSGANEVWCWGYDRGNLGLGTATGNGNSQYPKKIVGISHPTQLAIANGGPLYATTCALDGENVRCWGNNNNQGSVGVASSTGTFVATPTLVSTSASGTGVLDGVLDLQSGTHANAADFCARRTDDSVWCWGSGYMPYAAPYVMPNVVALGWAGDPRLLTSDGMYHLGATARAPNCGQL